MWENKQQENYTEIKTNKFTNEYMYKYNGTLNEKTELIKR